MLDASDLIAPHGRIRLSFFPDLDREQLEIEVTAWLMEAYRDSRVAAANDDSIDGRESARDRLARAWTEYRGFDAACAEMTANPASAEEVDMGSHTFARDQREKVCGWAVEALAAFNSLLPAATTADPRPATRSVTNVYEY
jgi:hypothetical protein